MFGLLINLKTQLQPEKLMSCRTTQAWEGWLKETESIYTRVRQESKRETTYQIASEGGTAPTNNLSKRLGMAKDLHQLSHSAAKDENGFKDWGLWDQFVAQQLAYFVDRLKNEKEGDGSLLDRCLIFQGDSL